MDGACQPQAACPTTYQRTITLNGTPSSHATMYRIVNPPPAIQQDRDRTMEEWTPVVEVHP